MNPLLISLLGVILVPLFLASWRASVLGLAGQGLLMALVSYRAGHAASSGGAWVALFDLAASRGVLVPLVLYAVLRARHARARNDVIPPNLLSWTVAIALVLVSFSFAGTLVPADGEQQTLVAVGCAGLMLGLLVLASGADPLSQVIGALRVENAIALFELGGEQHRAPPLLQLGQVAVFLGTAALFVFYLSATSSEDAAIAVEAEEPTL